MKTHRAIKAALVSAMVGAAAAGQTFAGTTTIQRSMTTTNSSGASCSQASDCGSCSISCQVGKSAICQSGTAVRARRKITRAVLRPRAFADSS